jgi:hypothetical protein
MVIDRHLIWDNITYFDANPRAFGVTSGNRLWSCAYVSGAGIKAKYSDNSGLSWNGPEAIFSSTSYQHTSLYINTNALHVVGAVHNLDASPVWNLRNGLWLGQETVKSDIVQGNNVPNVVVTSANKPYVFWFNTIAFPDEVRVKERTGVNTWANEVSTVATNSSIPSLTACIDNNNLMHAFWYEVSGSNRRVVTATYNGTAFSAHTLLDSWNSAINPTLKIQYTSSGETWALWRKAGIGVETAYTQVRYAIYTTGVGWGAVQTLTDFAGNHLGADIIYINGFIVCVYSEQGSYAPQSTIYNLVAQVYNPTSGTWGSKIQLTEEGTDQIYPDLAVIEADIHISWRSHDGANYDIYHGSFTPTPPVSRATTIETGKKTYLSPSKPGKTYIETS